MVTTVRLRENPGLAVLLDVIPEHLKPHEVDGSVVAGPGGGVMLVPVWAGEGFPLDVRKALRSLSESAVAGTPVVTARRMSSGAQQVLADAGVSWADAAGYADLRVPPGLVVYRGRPAPLPDKAVRAIRWSHSVDVVAEYLLSRRASMPGNLWNGVDRVAHIADATGVSNGQVAKVLVMFDEEGYTAKFGPERGPSSSRELSDASRLLSDWAGHYARTPRQLPKVDFHVPWRDPGEWTAVVREQLGSLPWGASGWVAADTIAPFVTQLPDLTVYVAESDFNDAVIRMTESPGVTRVDRGARIHMRAARASVLEFCVRRDNVPVVSPVRVYADLLKASGRGAEAADHLREVALGF